MRRAFFIGNGPSLRGVDLTRLEGELTFACNRIHLHPSWQAGWRPTHYLLTDFTHNPYFLEDLTRHVGQGHSVIVTDQLLAAARKRLEREGRPEPWAWWSEPRRLICCEHGNADDRPAEAWHKDGTICTFGGPAFQAPQLALRELGIEEMIFLGYDLGYRPVDQGPDPNHFDESYQPGGYSAEYAHHELRNETLRMAHAITAREAAARSVRTINATEGGHLDTYDRVPLDVLLAERP